MAEAGIADLNLSAWMALLAPAKTPRAIIDQLQRAVATAFDADLRAQLAESGIEVAPSTPEELQQLIAHDIRLHAELTRAAGLAQQQADRPGCRARGVARPGPGPLPAGADPFV